MKDLNYMSIAEDAIKKMKKGAFLTVRAGDKLNTMTIGWATFGFIWQKPIMMVMVRSSRYTFDIIDEADDFSVTVPAFDMSKELAFCGTKSGRDVNKFKECNLETGKSQKIVSPIIETAGYHYECKIVYSSAMHPALLAKDYDNLLYPLKDYHTLYFGEIMACYATE